MVTRCIDVFSFPPESCRRRVALQSSAPLLAVVRKSWSSAFYMRFDFDPSSPLEDGPISSTLSKVHLARFKPSPSPASSRKERTK
jgi:hypothetical protein